MFRDFSGGHKLVNRDPTDLRMRSDIDQDWRFQLGDPQNAHLRDFDDSSWRVLNLPHDWTIEGEYSPDNPSGPSCGYLPAGVAWYRRRVTIPDAWRVQRRVSLEFDGIFRNSQVYINGGLVGERAYGWISFAYDITNYVQLSGTFEIAVRVDNTLQPSARWYTGSGIYGHVYVLSTPLLHVDRYGTYVSTSQATAASATVAVETVVKNDSAQQAEVSVRSTVQDTDRRTWVVQQVSAGTSVAPGGGVTVSQTLTVPNPKMWSPDSPNLYRMYTEVLVGNQVVDDYYTTFGIRTVSFSATTGLTLNGQIVKMRGLADHWACGALGAALPLNIMRERLQMLKDMGANALRTSHNPRPSYFYEACDEMGLMVMDEVFDGWFKKAAHDYGAHSFATDWKKDVTEWVKRDRNHPAVVIWSIGNETGERDDNGIVKVIETMDRTRGTTGGTVTGGVSIAGINGPSEMPGSNSLSKTSRSWRRKRPTLGKLEACTRHRPGTGISFTKEFSRHPTSRTRRSFSMTG